MGYFRFCWQKDCKFIGVLVHCLQDAKQAEMEFFRNHEPWRLLHSNGDVVQQMGISQLVYAMSKQLISHTLHNLPEMKQKVGVQR